MTPQAQLPWEIYLIKGSRRDRPYAHASHVKIALHGRDRDALSRIRIYKNVVIGPEFADGWIDVTHEFLDENGGRRK